jgi:DNA ligase-1
MHLFEVPDLFSKLFYELDSTTKNSRKVQALTHYFNQAPDPDKLMVIAIFTGRRPKRQIKLSELKQWAIQTAQIPDWLFEESYSVVGDLAETIHLILQNSVSPYQLPSTPYPLPSTNYPVPGTQLPFIKLLTGGFRLGVSQGLLVQALHAHTGIEKDELNLRLMGNWTVQNSNYQDLIISPKPHRSEERRVGKECY